jgi:polyisoprenyl-teichoic acid--peptidoglycan teichoic acid transferase
MINKKQVNSNRSNPLFWGAFFLLLLILLVFLTSVRFFSNANINSTAGKTNILILGKSGEGHAGAQLTDTLIFASVSLAKPSVSLISIPRDIWIAEIRAKINSAYYWGNEKPELGGGISLVKSLTEKITGQPVHYAVVVDFSGFKEIIDAVGGIEVNVENSFTDAKYPIEGKENDLCDGDKEYKCRYETISFEKGLVHMDGATALKFVRSRNGDNNENTDLAREARQQKIIAAVKGEVLAFRNLINPVIDLKIYRVLKSSVETDIGWKAGVILSKKFFLGRNKITSNIFPGELLLNPPVSPRYDNQYVFIPKDNTFDEIHKWVTGIISN